MWGNKRNDLLAARKRYITARKPVPEHLSLEAIETACTPSQPNVLRDPEALVRTMDNLANGGVHGTVLRRFKKRGG